MRPPSRGRAGMRLKNISIRFARRSAAAAAGETSPQWARAALSSISSRFPAGPAAATSAICPQESR